MWIGILGELVPPPSATYFCETINLSGGTVDAVEASTWSQKWF